MERRTPHCDGLHRGVGWVLAIALAAPLAGCGTVRLSDDRGGIALLDAYAPGYVATDVIVDEAVYYDPLYDPLGAGTPFFFDEYYDFGFDWFDAYGYDEAVVIDDWYYADGYYDDGYFGDEYYEDSYYDDGFYIDPFSDEAYFDGWFYDDEYYDEYYDDEYYDDGYYDDSWYDDGYWDDGYDDDYGDWS